MITRKQAWASGVFSMVGTALGGVACYFIIGYMGAFDEKPLNPPPIEKVVMPSKHPGRTYEIVEFDYNHFHHTILIIKEVGMIAVEKIE